MSTTSYKLGRDAVAELPGVENDDIIDATINVSANQLDVTTYKAQPLTQGEYMAGLVDITVDVKCTHFTGEVGDSGTANIAGLPADLNATVLEVKVKPNIKGMVEYNVSYGFEPSQD